MTIMLAMNDGEYTATRPPLFDGGYNGVLMRYGKFVRELAKREKLIDADLNTGVAAALRKANEKDHHA